MGENETDRVGVDARVVSGVRTSRGEKNFFL